MAVYVDPLFPWIVTKRWPYGEVSHLFADSIDELHEFAIKNLGFKKSWFQNDGKLPHYDLNSSKRELAIIKGAVELDKYKASAKWKEIRQREVNK